MQQQEQQFAVTDERVNNIVEELLIQNPSIQTWLRKYSGMDTFICNYIAHIARVKSDADVVTHVLEMCTTIENNTSFFMLDDFDRLMIIVKDFVHDVARARLDIYAPTMSEEERIHIATRTIVPPALRRVIHNNACFWNVDGGN